MPDLRQLRTFVVVAEELNFTRAAERLFVAQQAVSRSVAALERELGVMLLNRTTHDVTLTPAGAALLESGRDVVAAADRAFAEAAAMGAGDAGAVRVGTTPAVGSGVRDQIARALREGAPTLVVDFREVRPRDLAQLLRKHTVDVVVARTAPDVRGLESAALAPTPANLLVPSGHRLAGDPSVSLADLDGERLLTWSPPGTPYTDLLVSRVAAGGARVEPIQSPLIGGGEPLALAETRAVALMPAGWPPGDDAVVVELTEQVDLPLLVIWLAGDRPPAVRRIRAALATSSAR
jgi:DNA-binding transcriptional LysR family regulator